MKVSLGRLAQNMQLAGPWRTLPCSSVVPAAESRKTTTSGWQRSSTAVLGTALLGLTCRPQRVQRVVLVGRRVRAEKKTKLAERPPVEVLLEFIQGSRTQGFLMQHYFIVLQTCGKVLFGCLFVYC